MLILNNILQFWKNSNKTASYHKLFKHEFKAMNIVIIVTTLVTVYPGCPPKYLHCNVFAKNASLNQHVATDLKISKWGTFFATANERRWIGEDDDDRQTGANNKNGMTIITPRSTVKNKRRNFKSKSKVPKRLLCPRVNPIN